MRKEPIKVAYIRDKHAILDKLRYAGSYCSFIVEKYAEGLSPRKIALIFGTSYSGVRAHLIKLGVKMRRRGYSNPNTRKLSPEDIKAIRASSLKPFKLAKEYGVHTKTITQILNYETYKEIS